MKSSAHHAKLISHRVIAQDTEEFVFQSHEPLKFTAGQFISVQVGIDENNNPILRSYSLASIPSEKNVFSLVLRIVQPGIGSKFFRELCYGDTIRFTGPLGFFVNDLSHPGDIVYAATGTGVAPLYPMLQEVLAREETKNVWLFWGVRVQQDLFWQHELMQLQKKHPNLHVNIYVSRPTHLYTGLIGRITQPILNLLERLQTPVFYLCGNGAMINELKRLLQEQGINRKQQIRTEAFFD